MATGPQGPSSAERVPAPSAGADKGRKSGAAVDYAKKYWWVGAIVVPIVVAVIVMPKDKDGPGAIYISNTQLGGDMYFTTTISLSESRSEEQLQQAVQLIQKGQYAEGLPIFKDLAEKA